MWQNASVAVLSLTLQEWVFLSACLLLALYIAGTWNYDYFERRGIPSKKPRLPFAGNTTDFFLVRRSFADVVKERYEWSKEHGAFGIFIFTDPGLIITGPELIKALAIKEFDYFTNHVTMHGDKTDPIFSKNLIHLKDQQWRDMRATLSPAFTTSKIKGMFPLISRCGEQMTQHLRTKYAASSEGAMQQPMDTDMKDLIARLANDIIASTAFGVDCDSLKSPENEFYRMGKTVTTFTILGTFAFMGYILCPKIIKAMGLRVLDARASRFFVALVQETIRARRRDEIVRPDMLQLLMQAQKGELQADKEDAHEAEDVGKKKRLTDEELSAQAMLFFFAGFETVSSAVCLTTYLLSHHPEEQKRLQSEIDEVMQKTGGKPTYEAVQSMKYLHAVINETLRLFPPAVATDRVCQRDTLLPATDKLGPILVTKGTIVIIPFLGLHRDPKYWAEPEKFDPDRFSDENKHKIKPFTYMPFGVGPRICIGERFALIEIKLILMHLLYHFDLHPCSKTQHPLQFMPGFNVRVRGGFWCGLTPRHEPERDIL